MLEISPSGNEKVQKLFIIGHLNYVCFISVLPPVLVPRQSEFAPGHTLLNFQQQLPEPMPNNVSFSQDGFVHSQLSGASISQLGNATLAGINQPPSPVGSVVSPNSQSPHSPYASVPGG